jgi:hypothetical protein
LLGLKVLPIEWKIIGRWLNPYQWCSCDRELTKICMWTRNWDGSLHALPSEGWRSDLVLSMAKWRRTLYILTSELSLNRLLKLCEVIHFCFIIIKKTNRHWWCNSYSIRKSNGRASNRVDVPILQGSTAWLWECDRKGCGKVVGFQWLKQKADSGVWVWEEGLHLSVGGWFVLRHAFNDCGWLHLRYPAFRWVIYCLIHH